MTITARPVERDEDGSYCHPDFFEGEFLNHEFNAWLLGNGLECSLEWMECDDNATALFELYLEKDAGFAHWEPERPEGEGWFTGAIYDTESGPLCIWLRAREVV